MAADNGRAGNALVAKLSQFAPLSDQDVRLLETLCKRRSKNPSLKRPVGPVAPE